MIRRYLNSYGEAAAADWVATTSDDELVRVCSVAGWLQSERHLEAPKALALAAVYVCEGAPRDLARIDRLPVPADQLHTEDSRRPKLPALMTTPEGYGVGDDARAYWAPRG